ncbi:MAG: quinohemoprotein amine dehydrogenase subunit alpha [Gemmatimonadaceae bacterium]
MHSRKVWIAAAGMIAAISAASAQGGRDTTTGFEIKDELILRNCSGCHVKDSTGRLGRLSFMRKTPEGWETSIRRMMTLQGVNVQPADARAIVRYLSDNQGLAPAELRPGRFEVERRSIEHRYTADTRTENTCRACHSLGRVITQRRTRPEWELVVAMHRGYYPGVDNQGFRRGGPPPPDSAGAPHPMDVAITHLARAFPLRTPEWAAWSATMRPPPIEGTWILSGTEPGRGAFYGRLTITNSGPAEYVTRATYRFAKTGASVVREGRSVVYTGFQWRGRSSESGARDQQWREVIFIEPGWQEMSGRWFRGDYDEFGIDVTLKRQTAAPVALGVAPKSLRSNAGGQDITVFGANLPPNAQALALNFGPGVRVERVNRATPDSVSVRVAVDSSAAIGLRDVFVAGTSLRNAVAVYDKIDRVRVLPRHGMARVGGANFPKQFAQFEAFAFHDGLDRKAETDDDLDLGPVDVSWALEEYAVTFDDDDLRYVGRIDQKGLFTPAVDGPNPERSGSRNNVGDVWVVATYPGERGGGGGAKPMKARSLLVSTVPLYMRWEPWRVEEPPRPTRTNALPDR